MIAIYSTPSRPHHGITEVTASSSRASYCQTIRRRFHEDFRIWTMLWALADRLNEELNHPTNHAANDSSQHHHVDDNVLRASLVNRLRSELLRHLHKGLRGRRVHHMRTSQPRSDQSYHSHEVFHGRWDHHSMHHRRRLHDLTRDHYEYDRARLQVNHHRNKHEWR